MANSFGSFRFIFPCTPSTPTLDFISTHSSPSSKNKLTVCCWSIKPSEAGDDCFVLVAWGTVDTSNSDILRVTHRDPIEIRNITFVLECNSGAQFSFLWNSNATELPQQLHISKESEARKSPLKRTHQPMSVSEAPCRQSKDGSWILGPHGRRILWVPPVNRGDGRWHGHCLIIAGQSGRLTLVDFSNANLYDTAIL
jgi:hypothetical protein